MLNVVFINVINNFELYQQYIVGNKFLKTKSFIQYICFDNTKENIFISKRYNAFLDNYDFSNEAWFIFCHPDWEIMEDIEPILEKLDKNKIYGPIGAAGNYNNIVKNKYFRVPKGYCLEIKRNGSEKKEIYDTELSGTDNIADTLDCQALFVHSSLIKKYNLRFDENLEWDLYVEDFCINAKLKHNIETQVVKIECCHHSDTGFKEPPKSYWNMLEHVNKKYPDKIFAGTLSPIGGKKVEMATEQEIFQALMFNKLRNNIKKGSACCV